MYVWYVIDIYIYNFFLQMAKVAKKWNFISKKIVYI